MAGISLALQQFSKDLDDIIKNEEETTPKLLDDSDSDDSDDAGSGAQQLDLGQIPLAGLRRLGDIPQNGENGDDSDSETNAEDPDIDLRNYQQELAQSALTGKNVIICAPTGSGKTRVALRVIQEHIRKLRRERRIPKVIFLVKQVELANQQGRRQVKEYLKHYRTKIIAGATRGQSVLTIKDYLERTDIFVVTAQIFLNALRKGENKISDFSLVILDECHHAHDKEPFNRIMHYYMDAKFDPNTRPKDLPQIIGMTASLGAGNADTDEGAVDHMVSLMANLDAKEICTVRENIGELTDFVSQTGERIELVRKRRHNEFEQCVTMIMEGIEQLMSVAPVSEGRTLSISAPSNKGSEQYITWLSDMHKSITQTHFTVTPRRFFSTCWKHLKGTELGLNGSEKEQNRIHINCHSRSGVGAGQGQVNVTDAINRNNFLTKRDTDLNSGNMVQCNELVFLGKHYNDAMILYKDARMKDAMEYLEEDMKTWRRRKKMITTETTLLKIFDRLKTFDFQNTSENPKLEKLKEIIMRHCLGNNMADCRAIVFVRTRSLARALVTWLNETPRLDELNAVEFVGANASCQKGGMTRTKQVDALKYFRGGQHKMIIATSVGEEGLDIAKCNLVVCYDHVTNEIARIQTRGRGRAADSKFFVIAEVGSGTAGKAERNEMLEKRMERALAILQAELRDNIPKFLMKINTIQRADKKERDLEKLRQIEMGNSGEEFEIRCKHCEKNFICMSSDVKKIENCHHAIIDPSIRERVLFEIWPVCIQFQTTATVGKIICKNCEDELGNVTLYKKVPFGVLKCTQMLVVDSEGCYCEPKRQWKKQPFVPGSISEDDLRIMAQAMMDDDDDDY